MRGGAIRWQNVIIAARAFRSASKSVTPTGAATACGNRILSVSRRLSRGHPGMSMFVRAVYGAAKLPVRHKIASSACERRLRVRIGLSRRITKQGPQFSSVGVLFLLRYCNCSVPPVSFQSALRALCVAKNLILVNPKCGVKRSFALQCALRALWDDKRGVWLHKC